MSLHLPQRAHFICRSLLVLFTNLVAYNSAFAADTWLSLLDIESPQEQIALAVRYEHGEGMPRDMGRAVFLYCQAARQGAADAQYALGWIYANGRDGLKDDKLAATWLAQAAAQGDQHAARLLTQLPAPETSVTGPRCLYPDGVSPLTRLTLDGKPDRRTIELAVTALAPEYGLQPELVMAVIETESNFQPGVVSHKGAMGLMQLIPATAKRFGVEDAFDPLQNLRGGMQYLSWLLNHFDGELKLALAGYNAGENAVKRYGGIPPYRETRNYVKRITSRYAG